jgi:LysR family cyn operon transcriptional activator
MELRHLRYFVALAEYLSFTRAAQRVHVTQSTLSHQIRRLEEEVGYLLFDRTGKRVALTEAGEVFLEFAANALREVDRGLGALQRDAADMAGQIRVGATNTFNLGFIPQCVASFLARHPNAKVIIDELSADDIRAKLNDGEMDLGIAYRPPGPSELDFEPLHNEEMVLAVSDRHALARRKRVRVVELHRQRLVLLPHAFATRGMLEECFLAAGAEPVVVAEMNTIAPMLELVMLTQVGAIVAANAVQPHAGLCIVPLESPTPIRIPGILRKRDVPQTVQMRSFASIVRKLAQARVQSLKAARRH